MGKPDGRSALFLEMDAKFRAIQNNQERIIKLLEGGDEKPKKEETITETYAWKLEMRRRMAQEAEIGKTRQEIIQPLIVARGDKSNFGCNTYTTVAARMRKNRIDFQAYADGYRKEKGIKRKVTNGELIDNIPALKREFLIPACGVNAPHQRYRTAIVAHANRIGQFHRTDEVKPAERGKPPQPESGRCCDAMAYSQSYHSWGLSIGEETKVTGFSGSSEDVSNPNRPGLQRERAKQQTAGTARDSKNVSDTGSKGFQDGAGKKMPEEQDAERYNSRRGEPDGTRQWAVEPNVGRVAHGIPNRVDRIKCLGNAVVPQQFYPIFKAIAEIELGAKTRI